MNSPRIIFFGSTTDSVLVLEKLPRELLVCIVTQPAKPIGRKHILTPTPTEIWAKNHKITVLSFPNSKETAFLYEDEPAVINTLESFKADLLISASYGQKIPTKTITDAQYGGLNVHPSLLPRWRGPDPIPWQILSGDHQTGVSVVTITEQMDEGKIIAQKKIPLLENETREPLRKKLFEFGADLLATSLPGYLDGSIKGEPQDAKKATLARRLTRDDGYLPWEIIQKFVNTQEVKPEELPAFLQQFKDVTLDKTLRALSPWPGVWTRINDKRLKILEGHMEHETFVLDTVQLEGKNPVRYQDIQPHLL